MTYKAPKKIKNHPAVESCEYGPDSGLDYKHDVFLKDGWVFSAGRMEGRQSGNFNSVAEFEYAEPMFEAAEPMNAAVNTGFCCALCGAGFDFGCRCPDW